MKKIINKQYQNLSPLITEFRSARPYPHIILDNFFSEDFFSRINSISDSIKTSEKKVDFTTTVERNKTIHLNKNSKFIKQTIDILSDEKWIKELRILTGIDDISAEDLNYGGLSNYLKTRLNQCF